jgi:hypothetical protein
MAGEAGFKNHMDMISLNEPVTKKAKFWQSYVRALKGKNTKTCYFYDWLFALPMLRMSIHCSLFSIVLGTDDMRADDSTYKRPRSRALSEFPDFFGGNSYSAPDPSQRIFAPGYRYLPVSRETYGYSPRPIYGYERPSTYVPRAGGLISPLNIFCITFERQSAC